MSIIATIAINTFRESVREKIFYSLLFFAVAMLLFSTILGNLTIGDPAKIIKDFGLGAISLFGTLIAIFVGIQLVYREIEKKTIYHILSKPVARYQFLLGKYAGLTLTIIIQTCIMSICLFALCYFYTREIPWNLLWAIIAVVFENQLVLAVALLFSSFSTPFLSSVFTLSIYIIGHFTGDLLLLVKNSENEGLKTLSTILFYGLPNLENLNFKAEVVHNLRIPHEKFILALSYGGCYTLFILFLAIAIFNYRDIK